MAACMALSPVWAIEFVKIGPRQNIPVLRQVCDWFFVEILVRGRDADSGGSGMPKKWDTLRWVHLYTRGEEHCDSPDC